jgi:hypothetical protein
MSKLQKQGTKGEEREEQTASEKQARSVRNELPARMDSRMVYEAAAAARYCEESESSRLLRRAGGDCGGSRRSRWAGGRREARAVYNSLLIASRYIIVCFNNFLVDCHTRVLGIQSPGANINTRCAGTKSHTYDA